MRPPDRRKVASVSSDLESSATFWKKLMIEEVSPEMWYSEPKMAGHFRAQAALAAATSARWVDMAVMKMAVRLRAKEKKERRCTAAEERRQLMLDVTLMLRVDCL